MHSYGTACVRGQAHLNVYLANLADFQVKFCITLEVSRILTTADLISLRIESRNRHIYDVVSVLSDVTMHIYTGKFWHYIVVSIQNHIYFSFLS
jgi:hypothetical protein